jgi:hypothetical protein
MSTQLYDLKPEYDSLTDLPMEAPDLSDDPHELSLELEAIREELNPKLLSLAKVVRTLEAEAGLLEEHGRALLGRASTRRLRVDYLKRWMQLQMEGAALERLKDPFVTLWLQKSPASIAVLNEEAVPAQYKRVTLKLPLSAVPPGLLGLVQSCDVDRAAIHELIKATGELPPGIEYVCDRRHLRIH